MELGQRELVKRLQSKDEGVQGEFFNTYWKEVYFICAHVLGSGPDACDTATDVLCDFIFDYVQKLERPEALRSYLRLMAVRRSLRRRTRRQELKGIDGNSLSDECGKNPEAAAETSMILPRLEECLKLLSLKAQQVLKLRFGGDLLNEQIGRLVGGSKQYIGRVIQRSLHSLKECLEQSGSEQTLR